MRKIGVLITINFFIHIASFQALALGMGSKLLLDIIDKKEDYLNKNTEIILRFKCFDPISDKIIFYDIKNYDIGFDISENKEKKFRNDILNLHEGLEYIVVFVLKDIDDFGNILADLISFKPLLLSKIPDG